MTTVVAVAPIPVPSSSSIVVDLSPPVVEPPVTTTTITGTSTVTTTIVTTTPTIISTADARRRRRAILALQKRSASALHNNSSSSASTVSTITPLEPVTSSSSSSCDGGAISDSSCNSNTKNNKKRKIAVRKKDSGSDASAADNDADAVALELLPSATAIISSSSSVTNQSSSSSKQKKPQMKYDPDIPMSKEEAAVWRREQRRKRNRESAAASRQRQRDRITELEGEVAEEVKKFEEVMARIRALEQATGVEPMEFSLPCSSLSDCTQYQQPYDSPSTIDIPTSFVEAPFTREDTNSPVPAEEVTSAPILNVVTPRASHPTTPNTVFVSPTSSNTDLYAAGLAAAACAVNKQAEASSSVVELPMIHEDEIADLVESLPTSLLLPSKMISRPAVKINHYGNNNKTTTMVEPEVATSYPAVVLAAVTATTTISPLPPLFPFVLDDVLHQQHADKTTTTTEAAMLTPDTCTSEISLEDDHDDDKMVGSDCMDSGDEHNRFDDVIKHAAAAAEIDPDIAVDETATSLLPLASAVDADFEEEPAGMVGGDDDVVPNPDADEAEMCEFLLDAVDWL